MENSKKRVQHWQIISSLLVIYDVIAIALSYGFALLLRYDFKFSKIEPEYVTIYLQTIPVYVVICVLVFLMFKMYRSVWRFASIDEGIRIIAATAITGVLYLVLVDLFISRMPLSYFIIGALLQFLVITFIRFFYRFLRFLKNTTALGNTKPKEETKVMIIGAGSCGIGVARELMKDNLINANIVCFIDDNSNKWGRFLDGVPIAGGRNTIVENANKYDVDRIIFAIPTATAQERKDILDICNETSRHIEAVPSVSQIINGEIKLSDIKEVDITDLLGRDSIKVDTEQILDELSGKIVMVTGGGGSIGSELCRQIATHNPRQLIIFDIYENNLYEIEQELKRNMPNLNLVALVGSVRDSKRLKQVFAAYRPEIVYHAAAHKHVPLMETSPNEAIKNNAVGTYKTAYAAVTHGCKKFVLISTDKAVNPTNVMGASKRMCEMTIQTFAKKIKEGKAAELKGFNSHDDILFNEEVEYAPTQFAAVRFGNVLGSNGSVIPLFKKQIQAGGPVTVTHPNITRFFMTIPEAVSLVLQAGAYATDGEIFVLDMGEPVKIDTLARQLIRLSGFTPDVDIKVQYVGLRPGEKMYEEKLMDEEGMKMTENKLIHIGKPIEFDENRYIEQLREIAAASMNNSNDIRKMISDIVPTYVFTPNN